MGGAFQTLTIEEIVEINRRMIERFGGEFMEADHNLMNPGSLEHVLEEIQGSLFGYVPYPTIVDKACAVCWRIIGGHIFHDGNKRTGMAACYLLLSLNGYTMQIDMGIIDMAERIVSKEVAFAEFVFWVTERCRPGGADPQSN